MKKIVFWLSICLLAQECFAETDILRKGSLLVDNIPEIPADLVDRLVPYLNTRYASFRGWLPNNKGMLIRTRFSDVSQIHLIETPKGFRQQLTFSKEPLNAVYICPDVNTPYFLFTSDSAGDERYQIYSFDYQTNKKRLLTDGKSKHGSIVWSNKGDKFAFCSTMRNGKDFDIYLGDLQKGKAFKKIFESTGYWMPIEFSPDDNRLLVKQYISSNESHYYILNITSMILSNINANDSPSAYGTAHWAKSGSGIYMVSDQSGEFKQLLYYDLKTEQIKVLTKNIPWDIEEFELSPSGDTIALISNENGISKLYFLNTKNYSLSQARLPAGLIYNLEYELNTGNLAMVINTVKSPTDVHTLNLKQKTFIRWTYSECAGVDTSGFVTYQLIHYPTFDSVNGKPRLIPAFYFKPTGYKPPYPVLIICHGGPATQYIPGFSPITQFCLNEMGIAVIAPNIRGSSGYGKEYMSLDDGSFRENAVRDIGALLDWIEGQSELNASRIAISGGSYGGYMVLASMVHYPGRIRCGVESFGISNFVTFLGNTGKYRQDMRRQEYGDERDPEMRKFLNQISPLTNAHKITRPLFVVQGLNDPRVPVTEAEQIVNAVRKNKVDVWYLLAEDEGHGLSKKSNHDYYEQAKVLFLTKYLLE
ncbi:MAG: alpha/beta fold hydrolase [bacterium]